MNNRSASLPLCVSLSSVYTRVHAVSRVLVRRVWVTDACLQSRLIVLMHATHCTVCTVQHHGVSPVLEIGKCAVFELVITNKFVVRCHVSLQRRNIDRIVIVGNCLCACHLHNLRSLLTTAGKSIIEWRYILKNVNQQQTVIMEIKLDWRYLGLLCAFVTSRTAHSAAECMFNNTA